MRSIHQKEARFARAGFIGMAAIAALTVLLFAGCGAESGGGDDDNLPKLEYVAKVCDTSMYPDFMDVSYDGLIFVKDSVYGSDEFIYVYTVSGEDKGVFKDSAGEAIEATMFFIDKSNLVNVVDAGFWTSNTLSRYRTDGTLYDQMSLEDSPSVSISNDGIVLLANGSIAMCNTLSNVIEYMTLDVINMDLEAVHSLTGPELVALIPGFADAGATEAKGVLTGIGTGGDNELYIAVEFDKGENDGVLVLNSDLTKKRYVGGDWDFNCPFDVATDGNGYHYVSNMSHGNVKVFDTSWSKVAVTDTDDSDSSILKEPSCMSVRGDYVYVHGSREIHRFKTYKDCPDETAAADPEHLSGGSGGEDNSAPVINSVPLVGIGHPDVNGNYKGGTFTYTASAYDPDNDDFSYEWELVEFGTTGHATLDYSGNTAIVMADTFGSGRVVLTVRDEHGATDTYTCDSYGPL